MYDVVVPKDNLLRKINELMDFSFVYDELKDKYCLDNGRKAIIVDATHTKARYNQKSPKEILTDRSKKLRKAVYTIDENM
ncbi:hypothetical protein NW802_27875, partial [Brevibacillus laterosporus]|nr:hypothetical protein [Brevibacillus laterosporus]